MSKKPTLQKLRAGHYRMRRGGWTFDIKNTMVGKYHWHIYRDRRFYAACETLSEAKIVLGMATPRYRPDYRKQSKRKR